MALSYLTQPLLETRKMTVPISGQITLSWDGASLKAEAPGRNGMRQKVEGILFSDLPIEIQHNLLSQIEAARDRARAELMTRQRENIQYVAETQPQGLSFIKKIWGAEHIISKKLRARVANPGQFDPISGKIKPENKNEKEVLDLGLNLEE